MFTKKKELIKQVNWALRLREPLCCGEVNDVRSKWTSEGYEVRFDGGSAMIAHFASRIVAIAWQQMGDVERHLFAKDLMEFLGVNVGFYYDLGHIASGVYAVSGNFRDAELRAKNIAENSLFDKSKKAKSGTKTSDPVVPLFGRKMHC